MKRQKKILVLFLVILCTYSHAQNNKIIYDAYVSGDMVKWKNEMISVEFRSNKTNSDKLDLLNFQHGYIAWCISREKTNEAEEYIDKSEELIEELEKKNYNPSMLFAYKAAIVGFEISISSYKAPFIGSKSLSLAKQAVSADPNNAFAYTQLGNIASHAPEMFGGSKSEALTHYLKALNLMDKQNNNINNWNYLHLLATIINTYVELEQYQKAKYYCEKTLAVEPNFIWVKKILYPQVLKQI